MRTFVALTLIALGALSFTALNREDSVLGAVITTINGSDRLTDSREVINTNFSNLNAAIAALFTPTTNYGTTVNSTSTPGWYTNGVYASSTSRFEALSANNASTTLLTAGTFWQTSAATSSFTGGINFTRMNFTATSTGSQGINIAAGCFAVNGTCIGDSGPGSGVSTKVNATTTTGSLSQAATIPSNFTALVFVNGQVAMNNTNSDQVVRLKMGGIVVQSLAVTRGGTAGTHHIFSFSYATSTATSTTFTVDDADALGNIDAAYFTIMLIPSAVLI